MNRRAFLRQAVAGAAVGLAGVAGGPKAMARGRAPYSPQASSLRIDREELLDFAEELVRIPSFTTEETEAARFLHDFFRREGFDSELQEVDPGRFQTIARLPGRGGGESLMLNGHIDIDPLPADLTRDPWSPTVEGDRFYGAGIGNMKGGVTAMVMASVAVRRARLPLRGDVVVACVVGELQGGAGTVHMLKSGIRTDVAIVTEPHGAGNILTKHAGVMQLAIHVIGRTAHISRKQQGVNAILKAAKVAETLENLELAGDRDAELPGLPLLNVGSILGGRGREVELRGPNIVPDFCTLYADIRFTQGMTPESIIADIRRSLDALARQDSDLVYEIEFPMKPERRCLREVMMPFSVPTDLALVQKLKTQVTAVRGAEPNVGVVLPNGYSGNDTSHLYAAGIPCCLYGPTGGGEGPERYLWMSVSEMMTCAQVYAGMIGEICS
ncbi:MAG: M20 family metallopeptidase [Acidobacteriota bacterium]